MTKNIFFSVIIPTYNRPLQLIRAINSVFNQTYKLFEIIVVNDGSTLNYEEAERIIHSYSTITYIKQENSGRSVARNTGVQNANGPFVCFLDDDDYYLPNHLEVLHQEIKNQNFQNGIYHTYTEVLHKDQKWEKQPIKKKDSSISEVTYYLTDGKMTMNNTCMHISILLEFPFDPSLYLAEDHHQRLRAMTKYPVFRINEYTTVYDKSAETTTNTLSLNGIRDYLNTWKKIFSVPEIFINTPSYIIKNMYNYHYRYILSYHRNEISWFEYLHVSLLIVTYDASPKNIELILKTAFWKLKKI